MRVSDSLRYTSFQRSIATLKERLTKSEEMIASGRKILAPSDDPVGSAQYIRLQAQQDSIDQYLDNLDTLSTLGGTIETSINGISDILTSAIELATTMASDTVDDTARTSAVEEVEGYIDELVALGNTKIGGTYIFGGTNSGVAPFTLNSDYSVTYNGSSSTTEVQVSEGQTMEVGMTGDEVFGTGGTSDIFSALKELRDALESGDTETISNSLDSLNSAVDLTASNLSHIGVYTNAISNLSDRLDAQSSQLTTTMAGIIECDLVSVYSDYTSLTTAYEAALSVLSKIQSTSVLDYL